MNYTTNMANWVVIYGNSRKWFVEHRHAESFLRALQHGGTECRLLHWLDVADESRG